jgi:hypothetical protein
MNFNYSTAAYTGGGGLTINWGAGGDQLTKSVEAASSIGGSADASILMLPNVPNNTGIPMVENGSINLVSESPFTNPGTAAGVIDWKLVYRLHSTGF